MTEQDLVKIAASNPEVRDAIVKLAAALEKKADAATQFNETVPAQAGDPAAAGPAAPAVVPNAPQGPVPGMPVGPEGAMPEQGGLNPSEEGAAAAQAFLSPVFDAAAAGDPNAQATIAKAAGEVAKGVATAAAEALSGGGGPEPIAPPVAPEEQIANQIVPPAKEAVAPENEKPEASKGPEKEQEKVSFDLNTVAALLSLVKNGTL